MTMCTRSQHQRWVAEAKERSTDERDSEDLICFGALPRADFLVAEIITEIMGLRRSVSFKIGKGKHFTEAKPGSKAAKILQVIGVRARHVKRQLDELYEEQCQRGVSYKISECTRLQALCRYETLQALGNRKEAAAHRAVLGAYDKLIALLHYKLVPAPWIHNL